MVKLVLSVNPDVNFALYDHANRCYITAVKLRMRQYFPKGFELLPDRGADLTKIRREDILYMLQKAFNGGGHESYLKMVEMLEMLKNRGVDLSCDESGKTILHYFWSNGIVGDSSVADIRNVVEAVMHVTKCDLDAVDLKGYTILDYLRNSLPKRNVDWKRTSITIAPLLQVLEELGARTGAEVSAQKAAPEE